MSMNGPGVVGATPVVVRTFVGGPDMEQRTCTVDGCERRLASSGLCHAHATRLRRRGDLQLDKPVGFHTRGMDTASALAARVDVMPNGCHQWTGYLSDQGYAWFRGKQAHPIAWTLANGPVPDGMELDHLCRNRACINPAHLEPVTHLENVRRGNAGSVNRSKTHCPQGHAYDERNTLVSRGSRVCRACNREKSLRHLARKAAAA